MARGYHKIIAIRDCGEVEKYIDQSILKMSILADMMKLTMKVLIKKIKNRGKVYV